MYKKKKKCVKWFMLNDVYNLIKQMRLKKIYTLIGCAYIFICFFFFISSNIMFVVILCLLKKKNCSKKRTITNEIENLNEIFSIKYFFHDSTDSNGNTIETNLYLMTDIN